MTHGFSSGTRLRVLIKGLLPSDWRSLPGRLWRHYVERASEASKTLDVHQSLEDVSRLAVNWVEGQANSKQAGAVRAFAEEEKVKIESELQRRALPSDLRKREAEAQKAEVEAYRERNSLSADVRKRQAEADKAEADARMARLQLEAAILAFIERQKTSGIVVLSAGQNVYVIDKVPESFDWDRYSAELLRAVVPGPQAPSLEPPDAPRLDHSA
jgi:hypothetical protein